MRVVFWGTPAPAVPSLEAFLSAPDMDVVAVVCNPDRPSGRGHKLAPPPVKVAALQAGVDVWQPQRPRAVLDDLRRLRPDACAVVAYGSILPADVLAAGGTGFVNLHFSLLPAWRGAAPVQHAILGGDACTGVTCFVLDEGMDTGPVLLHAETAMGARETAGELMSRLAQEGAPLLAAAVRGFVDGTLVPRPQEEAGASLAPKIAVGAARLDWARDAHALDRAVRAFNPVPGAHTDFGGDRLKVHRALPVGGSGALGEVIRIDDAGPVVACGTGALRLDEVQPAGKPRMPGPAFVNGYRPLGRRMG